MPCPFRGRGLSPDLFNISPSRIILSQIPAKSRILEDGLAPLTSVTLGAGLSQSGRIRWYVSPFGFSASMPNISVRSGSRLSMPVTVTVSPN